MYEELISHLRECAKADPSENTYDAAADAIVGLQKSKCPHYIRNVHDRGDDSLCREYHCEVKDLPRWIPVTERLPEDGQDILAVQSYADEVRIVPANYDRGVWYDCCFNRVAEHIAHWMPLPQPPKEE